MADASIRITAKDEASGVFASFRREMLATERATNITAAALSGLTGGLLAGASAGAFLLFAKNVNSGVDALNDIKDATGASIENISALEDIAARTGTRFETVGTSLVKFNSVLKDLDPDGKAAEIFKRIGLNAEQLRQLDPAEALRQTAVALSTVADDGDKARAVQELFGKSVREVAPFLKDLSEATKLQGTVSTEAALEAEKLNKEIFALQKNALDFSRVIVGEFSAAGNALISLMKDGTASSESFEKANKFLVTGLETIAVLGVNVAYVFKQVGNEIGAIAAQAAGLARGDFKQVAMIREMAVADAKEARREIDLLSGKILGAQKLARQTTASLAGVDTRSEDARLARQSGLKSIGAFSDKKQAAGKKGEDPLAIAKREAEELARLMDNLQAKEGGLDASFYKNWEILNREYAKGSISLERLTELQALMLAQQPGIAAAKKAEADAAAAYAKVFEDEQAAIAAWINEKSALEARAVQSAEKYLANIEFETRLIGMNNLEREKAIAARELEALGIRKNTEAYDEHIKKIGDAIDVKDKAAKAEESFKKTSDSVWNALRRGSDGFKDLIDEAIMQMLRLKIYEPIMKNFFGGLGGVGGSGGGGGLSGIFPGLTGPSGAGGGFSDVGGLGGIGGSVLNSIFGGFFANGGRPPVGKASIVGESGAEVFVPDSAGTIIPNNRLGGMVYAPVNHINITGPDSAELRRYVDRSLDARDRRLAQDMTDMVGA